MNPDQVVRAWLLSLSSVAASGVDVAPVLIDPVEWNTRLYIVSTVYQFNPVEYSPVCEIYAQIDVFGKPTEGSTHVPTNRTSALATYIEQEATTYRSPGQLQPPEGSLPSVTATDVRLVSGFIPVREEPQSLARWRGEIAIVYLRSSP